MASPAQDIASLLQTEGVGTLGSTIFYSREPVKDGVLITVYDIGGADPEPLWLRDYPNIQVRVKGTPNSYDATFSKAQEIKEALVNHDPVVIDTANYTGIWLTSDLVHLSNDESNRPVIVGQYRLIREWDSDVGNRLAL